MRKIIFICFGVLVCPFVFSYDGWVGETKLKSVRFQPLLTLVQVEKV